MNRRAAVRSGPVPAGFHYKKPHTGASAAAGENWNKGPDCVLRYISDKAKQYKTVPATAYWGFACFDARRDLKYPESGKRHHLSIGYK